MKTPSGRQGSKARLVLTVTTDCPEYQGPKDLKGTPVYQANAQTTTTLLSFALKDRRDRWDLPDLKGTKDRRDPTDRPDLQVQKGRKASKGRKESLVRPARTVSPVPTENRAHQVRKG